MSSVFKCLRAHIEAVKGAARSRMPVREKRKTAGAGVERVSEEEQGCAPVLHLIVAVRRGRELIDAV